MQERGLLRDEQRRPRAQPAAIDAVRSEGRRVLEVPRGVALEPGLLRLLSGGGLGLAQPLRALLAQLQNLAPRVVAPLLGARVRELGVVGRRDVAQIARQVHDFVVAQQRDDPPAAASGGLFQRHHEIQRAPHAGAAVQEIAQLDQNGVAADPGAAGVDQAGLRENRLERRKIAVDVADRHEPRRRARRRRREAQGDGEQMGEPHPEPPPAGRRGRDFGHHADSTQPRRRPGGRRSAGTAPGPRGPREVTSTSSPSLTPSRRRPRRSRAPRRGPCSPG